MGRGTFNSSNYLLGSQSLITGEPLTLAARFYPNATTSGAIWGLGHSGSNNSNAFTLRHNTKALAETWNNIGQIAAATSGNNVTTGAWNIAVARFASSTSRKILLNSDTANAGTDTTSRTPSASMDQCGIGVVPDSGPHGSLAGDVDWVAAWDVELTDEQALAVCEGVPPLQVATGDLQMFLHLSADSGNESMSVGGVTLTETGTVGTTAVQALRRAALSLGGGRIRSAWHWSGKDSVTAFAGSVTDSLALTTTIPGTAAAAALRAESLGLTSTQAATAATLAARVESLGLTSTESATSAAAAIVAEALALVSQESNAATTAGLVTDAVTLATVVTSAVSQRGTVVDSLAFTDVASAVAAATGTTVESLAFTDTVAAIAAATASAVEALAFTDTATGVMTTSAGVTVTVAFTDAITSTTGAVSVVTPAGRVIVIEASDRAITIQASNRTLRVH